MPLIETKGAASAQGFGLTLGFSGPVTYIEDVFSTWLYTGNASTQTITNGIDLSTKGGLVWIKNRNSTENNVWVDTARGAGIWLSSNDPNGNSSFDSSVFTSFNVNGFTLGYNALTNLISSRTYASWTFRKQPKFFDVVTYTGDGSNRTISHNLGSVPGCILVKQTNNPSVSNWQVYHRSLANTEYLVLNGTDAKATGTSRWNSTTPTSTVFSLGTASTVNDSGKTYVAYLFAHNAGGFGLSGTDNVISCGSFTTDGSGYGNVTLGYEPQWVLWKQTDAANNWQVADSMRGWVMTNDDAILYPNTSGAEVVTSVGNPTSTGIFFNTGVVAKTFIYIAIRRGPMKVPTSGTSVFVPVLQSGSLNVTTNFPVDLSLNRVVSGSSNFVMPRLTGQASTGSVVYSYTITDGAAAESAGSSFGLYYDQMKGMNQITSQAWPTGGSSIYWNFRRAPSFFDVVCYTGTGSARTVNHNLGVVPELMLVKVRSNTGSWAVYSATTGASSVLTLNAADASASIGSAYWNSTTPTSSVFSVGTIGNTNGSGFTLVAYLFATCAGVSKVGSYTGTGALQTVNCGFTGGARFVLIKRTDSTGDWYVYDSARGISSSSDPYLFLNSTAAEVTGTNYVDTTSVGFQVTAAAPAGLNANGGSYIFLAIA